MNINAKAAGNIRLFTLSVIICLFISHTLYSQDLQQSSLAAGTDSTVFEPYETKRSLGYHLLALPSYAVDLLAWPIGEGFRLAERKFPDQLEGERGRFGIYPLIETGVETRTAFGGLVFNRDFLGSDHEWRVEALFGSSNYNKLDLEYYIPGFFETEDEIRFNSVYYNDPMESLFLGNEASLDEETRYSVEEINAYIDYSLPVFEVHSVAFWGSYRNAIIRQSRTRNDNLDPFPASLKGRTELVAAGLSLRIDLAEEEPRTYTGRRFLFRGGYHHSIDDNRYAFFKYRLEWQEFIALPFLPNTRRLAFKTRLERAEPLADKTIPFFELPSVGDSRGLRGLRGDRYRDDKSLLFTLEYRYPMWDFVDVVLFLDEGQVFRNFNDVHIRDFHTGYGFGLHFLGSESLSFRVEFAFSKESTRTILSIAPNF